METRWLEDFLSLVETRNFSRSAEARYTTQPAFSRRIRSLEEWLGARLFDRSSQPIQLTPAGERFRPVAADVLRGLALGRELARQSDESAARTIRFATTYSLSLHFFPSWLRGVETGGNSFDTALESSTFRDCVQMLLRDECHFLLSYTHPAIDMPLAPDQFVAKRVLDDRLVPVTLADTAMEPVDRLPGTEDEPVHYLAYGESSAVGRAVERLLAAPPRPLFLTRVFLSQMTAVLHEMSAQGRGMAWLPETHVAQDLAQGRLVRAGGDEWAIPIALRILRRRSALPPAAEAFWALLAGDEETAWAQG